MTSSTKNTATEAAPEAKPVDMKLEVVVISVSDDDRAKAFYQKLGWRLDADFTISEDFRILQVTPHNSPTAFFFGKGLTSAAPGSAKGMVLAVNDVDAARNDLASRDIDVSEVYHYAGGPFNDTGENPRVNGRDPEGRSYFSFASFEDPDGNEWIFQEITSRIPGREWKPTNADIGKLAELLHETGLAHHNYEISHAEHNWWDWYAPYFSARQNGSTAEEASAAADRYMDDVHHIAAK